jgi:hypothetical protein
MSVKFVLALAFVLVVSILFVPKVSPSGPVPQTYGFDVSIAPDTETIGAFTAILRVKELGSGKIVAQPTIRFRSGEPAQTTATEGADGINFRFSVAVEKDNPVAQYSAEVYRGDDAISMSRAKIALSN